MTILNTVILILMHLVIFCLWTSLFSIKRDVSGTENQVISQWKSFRQFIPEQCFKLWMLSNHKLNVHCICEGIRITCIFGPFWYVCLFDIWFYVPVNNETWQ